MVDANTKKTVGAILQLRTKAGPRDEGLWVNRLKEEYQALIKANILFYIFMVYISCCLNLTLSKLFHSCSISTENEKPWSPYLKSHLAQCIYHIIIFKNRFKKLAILLINVCFQLCFTVDLGYNIIYRI